MASGARQRLGYGWVRRLPSSGACSGRSTATASPRCPAAGLPWSAWPSTSGGPLSQYRHQLALSTKRTDQTTQCHQTVATAGSSLLCKATAAAG